MNQSEVKPVKNEGKNLPKQKLNITNILKKYNLSSSIFNLFNNSGGSGVKSGRRMKYPYTFSAKIAQFPVKFHIQNGWLFRYYLIALVVASPIFYKIQRMSYSPENVKKWDEIRRREFGLIKSEKH